MSDIFVVIFKKFHGDCTFKLKNKSRLSPPQQPLTQGGHCQVPDPISNKTEWGLSR